MTTFTHRSLATVSGFLLALTIAGCGSDEVAAAPDHTPTSYNILINGVPATEPYTLLTNRSVQVQIKFFNAAGEDLDAVEAEHFAGLRFAPASLGTITRRSDRNYQFDVITGSAPESGTVQVSFGHDSSADEVSFPAAQLEVRAPGTD